MVYRYSEVNKLLERYLEGRRKSQSWDGGVAVIDNFRKVAFSLIFSWQLF